ncbi:ATP-grasp fold amidoligase family protein [Shouchella sp. 1P09AA]|uniref:ATP-grasp fold amidoligase family protein n=1 Tax=unclassified Shouchella TaxID=2893065 RepID=UPI00399F7C79
MKLKQLIKKNDNLLLFGDKLKSKYYNALPDEYLLKRLYYKRRGEKLNLESPKTFGEKLQWLKLNWQDDLATLCADKLQVRTYIKESIGEKYLNNIIAVYEDANEIKLEQLPKSFVIKTTHASGFNIIVEDKDKLNWHIEKKKLIRWLKFDYPSRNKEWVYEGIKPKLIVEEFMSEKESSSLIDYKFFCFNGITQYCQVIRGRGKNETIDFYDKDWCLMPFNGLRKLPNSEIEHKKPVDYEVMIDLANKLSKNFPFVRVDFYYVNGEIVFGEMTFFPTSGMGSFYPASWNTKIGDLINIEKLK